MKKHTAATPEAGLNLRILKSRQYLCFLLLFYSLLIPALSGSQALFAKSPATLISTFSKSDDAFLDKVQKQTFRYFNDCTNPTNGLVMDKALNLPIDQTHVDFAHAAATIAGVGFGLTALPVAVERGWVSRDKALALTHTTLKFFRDKMAHKHGFFYHFVDMKTGKRAMDCEISSIDTAIFIAGALFSAQYFADPEINRLALQLYSRINWPWMCDGKQFVSMGWTPEKGFIPASWDHYSEGMLLYILALGAPKHPLPAESWNFRRLWGRYKDYTYLINQPLFTHQFPQVWLDLRNKRDDFADYFENSRQATLANRQFCLDMRPSFKTFTENRWGLTACIGPNDYQAYGAPPNPAIVDGTVAPSAAASSLVFTPELSLAALQEYYQKTLADELNGPLVGRFGLSDSFNIDYNFIASESFAINQGSMLLMIENARSEFVWQTFMKIPFITAGMQKAGFITTTATGNTPDNDQIYETAAYMPHQRPAYECRSIPETFTIADTGFDASVWNDAYPMIIDKKLVQTIVAPPARDDFWILWKMLHNSKYLFLRFDIHDLELYAAHSTDKMYHDDCLEIYLNSRNQSFGWGADHNFQIIIAPNGTQDELRVKEFMKGDVLTSRLQWQYERLKVGYRVILQIPRQDFELSDTTQFAASIAAHNINASATIDMKYNWFFPLPAMLMPEIRLVESD